uniref:SURF1-like protein n=1 Tax=Heterorhabditis bacteriophora TaxID=37862 RepID=A0A1I7XS22_HETBA
MSGVFEEEADIQVGVVVKPITGHWRCVDQRQLCETGKKETIPRLNPSVWKAVTHKDHEDTNIRYITHVVYDNRNLPEEHSNENIADVRSDARRLTTLFDDSLEIVENKMDIKRKSVKERTNMYDLDGISGFKSLHTFDEIPK